MGSLKKFLFSLLTLLWFISYPLSVSAWSVIHYDQTNGFPGSYSYGAYQTQDGYIWFSTENGLARYNGYEFKLFTTKNGLPDNEVFSLAEDRNGRVWFAPFANTVGYMIHEKVYHGNNDALLQQLHFKARPEIIKFDFNGNTFIQEREVITCLSDKNNISQFNFTVHGINPLKMFEDSGKMYVANGWDVYGFTQGHFKKSFQLPNICQTKHLLLCHRLMSVAGIEEAITFSTKAIKSGIPLYNDENELNKINGVSRLSKDILAIFRKDGCLLVNINTARIFDTLLHHYDVADCLASNDGSLWLGTHGNGVFRFINSPIKSLKINVHVLPSIQYIGVQKHTVCAVSGNDGIVTGFFNDAGQVTGTRQMYIGGQRSYHLHCYLERNKVNNWISCSDGIFEYKNLAERPVRKIMTGYCKDVLEENEEHLLVATHASLIRLDKTRFTVTDVLINKRVTAVTKSGNTIYAGTLNGLLAGEAAGKFHQIFPSNPAVNGHIVKLCKDIYNTIWVANNLGELIAITGDSITAIINEKSGLQCNRISAIQASEHFLWVGTDNGLYAIQSVPPYNIVRHLTYSTGLNSNQVNCITVRNAKVWIGTTRGVNYFNEQDVFQLLPEPHLIVNKINSGNQDIAQGSGKITLLQHDLTINFDIIDQIGGQKPLYQYRLNGQGEWIDIENSTLYFPTIPYGNFKVDIKAASPNWKGSSSYLLRFYHPYPIYLRWWFLAGCTLAFTALITGALIFFIRRLRRKDHEKLSVQRNLLQLEQLALQGQMNPHFIFNCISAIKQFYSIGDNDKADAFVDSFAALIRQTFEMSSEILVPLDKELSYLTRYLSIEQSRFNDSFTFAVTKDLLLPENKIPVPAMLLQPLAENAVRHGVRHLTNREGEILITVTQNKDGVEITITDNGIGRQESLDFRSNITSTTVNRKRIEIMNRLFESQLTCTTTDVLDVRGWVGGTRVTISYPLTISNLSP